MENDFNIQIGKRLREIREIFNFGVKLSAEQFAYIVDETGDKIRNYELGRANIPIRLVYKLYKHGIEPKYLLCGEGEIFAENEEGKRLRSIIEENIKKKKANLENKIIKVSAGKIEL